MVEFGKQLVAAAEQENAWWKEQYLDYNYLKTLLLKEPQSSSSYAQKGTNDVAMVRRSNEETVSGDFRKELDREIEKVVLFLLEEQGKIASELSCLSLKKTKMMDDFVAGQSSSYPEKEASVTAQSRVEGLLERYRMAGQDLLKLVHFLELNVTAVRKILKKHDKRIKTMRLSQRYLSTISEASDSHLHQLYHYGGLSALVKTLQSSFTELRRIEKYIQTETLVRNSNFAQSNTGLNRIMTEPNFPISYGTLDNGGKIKLIQSSCDLATTDNSSSRALNVMEEEAVLQSIAAARRRLKQSSRYVEIVAAQALLFDDQASEIDAVAEGRFGVERSTSEKVSSLLNLCSTCLYMTNYYIIAPTSSAYAAKLGSSEAMSGIIIGMTPNAALLATVLYCWWSNYSYKSALLFAAGSSLTGNIFYALALHYDSLTMVLIGRFLNGFGSARSINRRFIADTFSRNERTAASADFVTAGALGMALGPAIAALLGSIDSSTKAEGNNFWTSETSPGWIMFAVWSIFFIALVFFFKEPDRSHLHCPSTPKSIEFASDEEKRLLSHADNAHCSGKISPAASKKMSGGASLYMNVPVMMTLFLYFVLKLVLECLLSSSAIITGYYFKWNAQYNGAFLAILGLLMFPANLAVAKLSHVYDDREIIFSSLWIMLLGIVGFLSYGQYSPAQYVTFGVVIFLSTNILEGPNMSLLSKTIPKSWAKGTFNSGFMATEAGTLARSVGDVLISTVATFLGSGNLLNWTFLPLAFLVLLSIRLTWKYYTKLVEHDDDEDSNVSLIALVTN